MLMVAGKILPASPSSMIFWPQANRKFVHMSISLPAGQWLHFMLSTCSTVHYVRHYTDLYVQKWSFPPSTFKYTFPNSPISFWHKSAQGHWYYEAPSHFHMYLPLLSLTHVEFIHDLFHIFGQFPITTKWHSSLSEIPVMFSLLPP